MLIPDVAFRENRSQRLLSVLVHDLSTSMLDRASASEQSKIALLNDARPTFAGAVKADEQAERSVQIAEVCFGRQDEVWTETEPCDAATFDPKPLTANGTTPLGAAVQYALDLCVRTTRTYREHGIGHWVPWIWVKTDGVPTDDWEAVAAAAREAEARRDVIMFMVGIGASADLEVLAAFSNERPPLRIEAVHYSEFFLWLSRSLSAASRSRPGEEIDLGFGKAVRT